MTEVLVIGSNGQLGSEIVKILQQRKQDFTGLTHEEIEVTNYGIVRQLLERYKPSLVINTAAYHKVDACEENPEKAFTVNAVGAGNIARVCRDMGASIVHLSTDYVFDGKKGSYIETDAANPLNVYGASKIGGETLVKAILPEHFIVRTAAIQGLSKSTVKGSNFIETMLKNGKEKGIVKVVYDQITSPTYAPDLADRILKLAETRQFGTYHLTNDGFCSWYDFAKTIFDLSDMKVDVIPISSEEALKVFNYKAKRPLNTSLNISEIKNLGINMQPWVNATESYLIERERANGI